MFYSHEILTSRKYGIATVWIVATLGANNKKVSRKEILDVNVLKTCETIAEPSVPLALRLQSSLLFGVARVFAKQCSYVLSDAEAARAQMRAVLKAMGTSKLNAEGANKTRPGQMVLGDDPSFMPELDFALEDFGMFLEGDALSNLAMTASLATNLSDRRFGSLLADPTLKLDSLDSLFSPNKFPGACAAHDEASGTELADRQPLPQYQGLQDDLGLMLDDGDFAMPDVAAFDNQRAEGSVATPAAATGLHDPVIGNYADVLMQNDDDDVLRRPLFSSTSPPIAPNDAAFMPRAVTSSESARAPLRLHAKKTVRLDTHTQISNSTIKEQQQGYLDNMDHDLVRKRALLEQALAKKNAALWFMGDHDVQNGPLATFRGERLLVAVNAPGLQLNELKRTREDDAEVESPRRVRLRNESDHREVSQSDDLQQDFYVPEFDDIERGREQPTPLEDLHESTLLPWNQSSASRGRLSQGFSNRQRQLSLARRFNRHSSMSPLAGHGMFAPAADRFSDTPGPLRGMGSEADGFEAYGPAAQAEPQTASDSQWLRNALNIESTNFLDFIQDKMRELDLVDATTDFSALLPPTQHTRAVASQALLHVLTLCTRNFLSAEQEEAYGSIVLATV